MSDKPAPIAWVWQAGSDDVDRYVVAYKNVVSYCVRHRLIHQEELIRQYPSTRVPQWLCATLLRLQEAAFGEQCIGVLRCLFSDPTPERRRMAVAVAQAGLEREQLLEALMNLVIQPKDAR